MYEIIEYDKEVFLFLNNLGSKPFDQFWIMVSKTFIWVPFYVVLFYFLFKNFGKRNMIYIIIFIALGVTISDQMAGIFKDSVMRLRPCHEPTLD
ncbi:MAG: phosphatase PAP2 family protein, partial [Bergeyella zoohelcum]|nr:phosphatase PAP2 family protein [Bergeyella zoohelcum]